MTADNGDDESSQNCRKQRDSPCYVCLHQKMCNQHYQYFIAFLGHPKNTKSINIFGIFSLGHLRETDTKSGFVVCGEC
ncbi:hypothetical protein Ocin01_03742 [Orchesella cincta]|uniref:Uncharacterized protein n=1 Tax=Orchesella cincta TaxID=48709 RepID=A0A1D2NCH1_ORCCI|nr:hypothetical protein Ocin01_03742 [Orchesella cincta]